MGRTSRKTVSTIAAVLSACFIVATIAFGVYIVGAAPVESSNKYNVNGYGLTYGSAKDAGYGEEPELIAAEATNGKDGYIRKDDLLKMSREASNPVQANQIMKPINEKASKAFIDSLAKKHVMKASVSNDKIMDSLLAGETYCKGDHTKESLKLACDKVKTNLGITKDISEDTLAAAVVAADKANAVLIPVYDLNGMTQIGVFQAF